MKYQIIILYFALTFLSFVAHSSTQFVVKTDGTVLTQEILDEMNLFSSIDLQFVRHSFQNYYIVEERQIEPNDAIAVESLISVYSNFPTVTSIRPQKEFKPRLIPTDASFSQQWYFKQGDYPTNNNGIDGKTLWEAHIGWVKTNGQ